VEWPQYDTQYRFRTPNRVSSSSEVSNGYAQRNYLLPHGQITKQATSSRY
jgi:hypothetical protein